MSRIAWACQGVIDGWAPFGRTSVRLVAGVVSSLERTRLGLLRESEFHLQGHPD